MLTNIIGATLGSVSAAFREMKNTTNVIKRKREQFTGVYSSK